MIPTAFRYLIALLLGALALGIFDLCTMPRADTHARGLDAATAAGLLPFWMSSASVQTGCYQCTDCTDGCPAIMPGEDGPPPPGGKGRKGKKYTKTVQFKCGDILCSASGWIVNEAFGWEVVD